MAPNSVRCAGVSPLGKRYVVGKRSLEHHRDATRRNETVEIVALAGAVV